jgi:hypothetical protein
MRISVLSHPVPIGTILTIVSRNGQRLGFEQGGCQNLNEVELGLTSYPCGLFEAQGQNSKREIVKGKRESSTSRKISEHGD